MYRLEDIFQDSLRYVDRARRRFSMRTYLYRNSHYKQKSFIIVFKNVFMFKRPSSQYFLEFCIPHIFQKEYTKPVDKEWPVDLKCRYHIFVCRSYFFYLYSKSSFHLLIHACMCCHLKFWYITYSAIIHIGMFRNRYLWNLHSLL